MLQKTESEFYAKINPSTLTSWDLAVQSCNWYVGLAYLSLTTKLSFVQLGPRQKSKDLAKSRTLKSLTNPKFFWALNFSLS